MADEVALSNIAQGLQRSVGFKNQQDARARTEVNVPACILLSGVTGAQNGEPDIQYFLLSYV